jgi:hypothetical protein
MSFQKYTLFLFYYHAINLTATTSANDFNHNLNYFISPIRQDGQRFKSTHMQFAYFQNSQVFLKI